MKNIKFFKRFISFLSIILIIFLNINTTIYAISYNNTSKISSTDNYQISSKDLITIVIKKWLNSNWIKTFFDIKWVTTQDIRNLRKKSLREKRDFVRKLFQVWLTKSQIDRIKNNHWFTSKWYSLLKTFHHQVITNNYWFSNTSLFWKNFNNNKFITKQKTWEYKINYNDIIPWKNAWVVQANFVWLNNFPSKLILEKWFSFDLNHKSLDKSLKRTNKLLNEINTLKKQNIQIWNLNISEPEITILPDRISYNKQVDLTFQNKNEFDNIKKYLWEYFNPNSMQDISSAFLTQNSENKYVNISWNTNNFESSIKDFDKNLVLACKQKNNNSSKCDNLKIDNLNKTITFNEKIDFSIIPLTIEDLKSWNIFINKDPKQVKITKSEILKRFDLLRAIQLKKDFWLANAEIKWEIPKHNMNDPKYCDIYYETELKSAKHKNDSTKINDVNKKINECKNLQKDVNKVTKSNYKQNLLNWFTIWESKSYSWSTSISVDTKIFWTIDIFDFDFEFYYLYAVGIRIPLVIIWEVKDSKVHDYSNENTQAKVDFETKVKLKSINWDSNFYKEVWVAGNHIYDWKELVLEFSSWIKFHVRTPITSHIHYEVKLASLLVGQIEDSLKKMWLSQAKINEFKNNNLIDLSKDFTPPLWWENLLNLLTLESNPIVLFSIYWIDLLGKIWLNVDVDWRVTSKCKSINAVWWCPVWDSSSSSVEANYKETSINIWNNPSRIHYNSLNYYIWNWKAIFNWKEAIQDELWPNSRFWIELNDFKYHPILLMTIYALVWVWIPDVPYIWDLVVWSPEIDIYKIKFTSDKLYLKTHSWTNWVFDMSSKNKIYSTSSTLTDITSMSVEKIEWKIIPRSKLIIKPETNTSNWNAIFYRIDWNYPQCKIDNNTNAYFPQDPIWSNAKDELVNKKLFNYKAIACDMFNPTDPRAKKTYRKNFLVETTNYYHKPIIADLIVNSCVDPLNSGWNKNYKQNTSNWYEYTLNYFDNNSNNLSQEEIETLNFEMPRNNPLQTSYIKILSHPENKPYIIKYSFVDKNPTNNNFSLFNTNTNISLTTDTDICNSNSWKVYNWEVFVAWNDWSTIQNIPENYNVNNIQDKIVYYNQDKILKTVKCIKKDDWKYFQSLTTKANINVKDVTSWACSQSTPIDQNWWIINLNAKMKKNIIDPIFNLENNFKTNLNNNFNVNY